MFNDFELLHFIDMALSTTTEKNKYPQKDCKDKLYQESRSSNNNTAILWDPSQGKTKVDLS